MNVIPSHILEQLHQLIEEKLPAEQIAFMMRLDEAVVRAEMARINTTKNQAVSGSR
jgi:hypothetical protein